jgi:hypothetical protein
LIKQKKMVTINFIFGLFIFSTKSIYLQRKLSLAATINTALDRTLRVRLRHKLARGQDPAKLVSIGRANLGVARDQKTAIVPGRSFTQDRAYGFALSLFDSILVATMRSIESTKSI